ncbi:retron Ec78 anti-phage system effector HNH endonuclease PtuB [Chromobacterium vaccinii]|uniref:retron Ec78 anti-phage system effector HNH endonuclease PtuB n=1 Tax=Chromobacterium vaccinii TaxID=1108595 RepID=UPI001C92CEA1|nr:retron Ec78 anti-phage system effector HNH endonuclease PtuB [Chromobacterium vaccinii]
MKKLNRPQPEPACLNKLRIANKKWGRSSPNSNHRNEIWNSLTEMQGNFCCYCESSFSTNEKHIEHFFFKGSDNNGNRPYEHLTYDWSNLFGSCGKDAGASCGHFKDKEGTNGPGQYNVTDLIKPDVEDPSEFLTFSQAGSIIALPNLEDDKSIRANETIRILNLNFSVLIAARKRRIDILEKK